MTRGSRRAVASDTGSGSKGVATGFVIGSLVLVCALGAATDSSEQRDRDSVTVMGAGANGSVSESEQSMASVEHRLTGVECVACHQPDPDASHPTGMAPKMPTPDHLPLTDDGRMTCLTCHDYDVATWREHALAPDARPIELRLSVDRERLCLQCHDASMTERRDAHALVYQRAHVGWVAGGPTERDPEGRPPREMIDLESRTCMGCHDGAMGGDVSEGHDPVFPDRGATLGDVHAIGVPYRSSQRVPLKPAFSLDPDIRLFDGRVGCGSCHSVYSREERLLVMSNHGSALCMSCHDMN